MNDKESAEESAKYWRRKAIEYQVDLDNGSDESLYSMKSEPVQNAKNQQSTHDEGSQRQIELIKFLHEEIKIKDVKVQLKQKVITKLEHELQSCICKSNYYIKPKIGTLDNNFLGAVSFTQSTK